MRDVPPGDESGIYYILISGVCRDMPLAPPRTSLASPDSGSKKLPFATIWQLLKDWLRQAGCDVDHIQVFQKSTSGWVRLIGKDNFERALRRFCAPYRFRKIAADGDSRPPPDGSVQQPASSLPGQEQVRAP